MLVSENWLREWVSPKINSAALAERLTLAGLEVESIQRAGPDLDNSKILIGKILDVVPHPHAKKLNLCKLDIGKSRRLAIVCGADNARVGTNTAVALAKAKLPGMTVSLREIRGIKSQGMICSAMELGLEDSSEGILEFDAKAPIGVGVSDYLDLGDAVFDLQLTPNRGDCLGMVGVAREVATLTSSRLRLKNQKKISAAVDVALPVILDAPEGCPRYVGRSIMGIDMNAKSPDWMVERLRRSGMRSINPIVDITNYVMHELGQPMHAFDFDKLVGGVRVRMAKQGERLKLLDRSLVKLTKSNLVIADHQKAIALAGIMGGDDSAISSKTTNIYLEAAYFSPQGILGKARELGMQTDASHRFERGVDSELQLTAMERATALVLEIAGGQAGPITHGSEKSALPKQAKINFEQREISRILGLPIPTRKVTSILERLGMKVKRINIGWQVRPPSWRHDICGQHDLVEEVGRCYGFDKIPPRAPVSAQIIGNHPESRLNEQDIKQTFIGLGYHEAITYSFVEPGFQSQLLGKNNGIKLSNPISENMSVMRQSLWPGLMMALKTNINRQENRVRLFEIGHVFFKAKNQRQSTEQNKLGGLICGPVAPRQWEKKSTNADFFDIKGDLESAIESTGFAECFHFKTAKHSALHPGESAAICFGKKPIGHIGRLHPSHQSRNDIDCPVYLFEINLDVLINAKLPEYKDISKFPAVERDLAILVDESVAVQLILDLIQKSAGALLEKLELFDIYRGNNIEKNKKNLAFSLTFQSESSNLTSVEVDAIISKIIQALDKEFGAKLRV